jgi:hypothetical protein
MKLQVHNSNIYLYEWKGIRLNKGATIILAKDVWQSKKRLQLLSKEIDNCELPYSRLSWRMLDDTGYIN